MSSNAESEIDKYESMNYDNDKAMYSGHSGKQRNKKEVAQNNSRSGGNERKIAENLMNNDANNKSGKK